MSGALAAAGEGAAVGGLMGAAGGALGGGRAGARSEEAEGAGEAEAGAEEDSAGASCPIHSFTAETPVLLADGTSKPISQIKVGDQITNAVPGDDHTQVHTVERVIVTTTDHDFVDVTVKADHSAGGVNTGAKTGLQTKARTWTGKLRAAVAAVALAAVTVTSTATPAAAATPQASPVADPVTVSASTAAGSTLTTTFHHPFFDITQAAFTEADNLHTGDRLQTTDGGTATITNLRLYHQTTTTYDLTIGGLHTYYVLAGPTPLLVHNINAPIACSLSGEPIYDIPTGSSNGAGAGKRIPSSLLHAYNVGKNSDPAASTPLCSYCRTNPATSIDHVNPRVAGGDLTDQNTTPACTFCNSSKRDRLAPQNPPANYAGPWPPPFWPPRMKSP